MAIDLVGFARREIRRPIAMAAIIAAILFVLGMFQNILAIGIGKWLLVIGLVLTGVWVFKSAV